jgi:hypothetical protein
VVLLRGRQLLQGVEFELHCHRLLVPESVYACGGSVRVVGSGATGDPCSRRSTRPVDGVIRESSMGAAVSSGIHWRGP